MSPGIRTCKCGCGTEFRGNQSRAYLPGHRGLNPERYFWQYVDRAEPNACWVWTGGTSNKGYGSFWDSERKRKVGAHIFSYDLHNKDRVDEWVLHRCDNPPCVNPDHLFLGTALTNVQDMIAKKRNRLPDVSLWPRRPDGTFMRHTKEP